jgi:hypothetical protein
MEESIMVMEKARPHLRVLSELAPQLNQVTDRYMVELREIEAGLNEFNLGIEVELEKPIQESNRFEEETEEQEPTGVSFSSSWTLGYGKYGLSAVNREWCLFVRKYTVYSDDRGWCEDTTVPLRSASRDLRIAAADYIPELLELITERVKEKIAALSKVSDKR